MRLGDLVPGGGEAVVTGFAIDHRRVAPGCVFGAFPGARFDGEGFIADAVAAGAIAVVARPQAIVAGALHIADSAPRTRFARLAAPFFAPFPTTAVAVTGTNGKTSTVELARQLWGMAGHRAASVGTLGVTVGDDRQPTGLTTPDIVTFLGTMGGLAREGVSHVAFEASSHGLDQRRTEGVPVAAAAFTNLSRDHLDYHGDMATYFAAKLRLFTELVMPGGGAVVWADDGWSAEVARVARGCGLRVITVGRAGDELRLIDAHPTALGQKLVLATAAGTLSVELPLIGGYQVANALVAAGLVLATGGEVAATVAHLARLRPVRGRLERAALTRTGAPVYVDYAHTPDAIEAAAAALRAHTHGRIILVFGAGGERDEGKRPLMGAAAARVAEIAIVTDDNPRGESAATIRSAVLAGAEGLREIGDRAEAIGWAVREARAGDTVLIAGKGHETGQIVGGRVLPFDDVEIARGAVAA